MGSFFLSSSSSSSSSSSDTHVHKAQVIAPRLFLAVSCGAADGGLEACGVLAFHPRLSLLRQTPTAVNINVNVNVNHY